MTQTRMRRVLAAAGFLCCAIAGVPAQAQSDSTRATTAPGAMSPAAKLQRADQGMLRDIAQANMAEIATGKLAAPFTTLTNMVLSHASDDAAEVDGKSIGSKSLVNNLKSMLAKPKAKAA